MSSALVAVARLVAFVTLTTVVACWPASGRRGTTIINVRIIDGTGAPAVSGALRFVGDTIVAVGAVTAARGDTVIDGAGMVLAPGFIDTHSHHAGGLLRTPDALGAVSQGITTIVAGNDGSHAMPLAQQFDTLTKVGPSVNVAYYAGHGTIRSAVMGDDFRRHATPAEPHLVSAGMAAQHTRGNGIPAPASGMNERGDRSRSPHSLIACMTHDGLTTRRQQPWTPTVRNRLRRH